jgi:taurine--2-oxoglutarate transaminase
LANISSAAVSPVVEADHAYVFHSWSAQGTLPSFAVDRAAGCYVWDDSGRQYLDFSSQLIYANIGYAHPRVVAAIQEQAAKLATISPGTVNAQRAEAARLILSHLDGSFAKIFFTNGGADANENAIRLARLFTGRAKVISHYRSYHGNTGAAICASGDWRRIPNEFARGHVHVFGPYLYRSEFWASTPEEECERALRHLERVIQAEGPETVAAILFESIPGTAGILVPPPGYLAGVRSIADKYGIVLILDEVMAGFGRAGQWFAFEDDNVVPDLVTFAKGVNSGYVPVGGVAISESIADSFTDRVFPGGLTYSGHPLGAAAVVANITAMEDEGVIENAAHIGDHVLGPELLALARRHPVVGEVRGAGVFWAVELVSDRTTREPLTPVAMSALKQTLLDRGLIPIIQENRIHVVPPCIVTAAQAHAGVAIIDAALTEIEDSVGAIR